MKRYGVSFVLVAVLLCPQVSAAAVSPAVEREILLQQISLLQATIAELTALLEARQTATTSVSPGPYTAQVSVLAKYLPTAPNTWVITDPQHRSYLTELLATWPKQYASRITQLVIFDESQAPFDAYVESRTDGLTTWTYGVGDELVTEPLSEANQELQVHELAHVFAYDRASVRLQTKQLCGTYFSDLDCPPLDSYLGQFIATFWTTGQLADADRLRAAIDTEAAAFRYYEANPGEFVSDYAAQNPVEDFAESYLFYMQELPLDCRDCVAADKVAFFKQFPELQLF